MGDQIINTRITADIAQAEQGIRSIKRDISSLGDTAKSLISPINMVKTALASLSAWSGIQGLRSIIDTALAMERLNTQFRVVMNSAVLGQAEFRFVTNEAKRLGQEITVLGSAYNRLLQATKGTKFEGAPTKAMFSGFSEAFTSLKMTSDQMSGVWLQINQGMMKGKIQLEDVNIIAERGLNIIKLLEISTGKSSKELMDMISKSKLTADEYMKLGPLLSQIYGGAAKTAAQELQGTINNFGNEFMILKAKIGSDYTPAFSTFLKTITANMNGIVEAIKNIGIAAAAVFAGRTLSSFASKVNASGGFLSQPVTNPMANSKAAAESLANAKALMAYESASVSLAQAEMRRLTIMQSSGAVAASDIAFKREMTAATTTLTQAELRYAAAKDAVTAATTRTSIAMKAAGVIFTAMGGWIGAIIITLTAGVMWWNKYSKAQAAAKAAAEGSKDFAALEERLAAANKQIAINTGDMKGLSVINNTEASKVLAGMLKELNTLKKASDDSMTGVKNGKAYADWQTAIKKQQKAIQDYLPMLQKVKEAESKLAKIQKSLTTPFTPPGKAAKAHKEHLDSLASELAALERLEQSYRRVADATTDANQAGIRNGRNEALAKLEAQHDMMLISTKDFLQQKEVLEKAAADQNIANLTAQYERAKAATDKATAPFGGGAVTGKQQEIANAAIADETKKRSELEKAISVERERGIKTPLTLYKNNVDEAKKLLAVETKIAAMREENTTAAASMVGANASGGFDSITDQIANQMAMQQQAHENRIANITKESQALLDQADKIDGLAAREKAYQDIATGDSNARALAEKKNSQATTKIAEDGYKSQLSAASQYTGMAGQFFTALASTQDQSSRSGFESAKALSLAAAVMSTAQAIMAQLTIPGPVGWAGAALAAATGVIQVAKIASTSFGGGSGSVSAPAGSVASSGGESGTGLSNIATPMTSIQDSHTQDTSKLLANAVDRNSVVIGRLSKTIEELNDLFKSGGAGNGLAVNAPGRFDSVSQQASTGSTLFKNLYTAGGTAFDLGAILGYDPKALIAGIKSTVSAIGGALFGGKTTANAAGMSINMSGGTASVQDYTDYSKKGGVFSSGKKWTTYSDNQDAGDYLNALMKPFITDLGTMADTLGLVFDPAQYKASAVKISTAGKTSEQIGEELSNLMASTLSGMTLTIDGMDALIGNYEDAYIRIKQINDAWVTANDQLQLVGISPLARGGQTAVDAENAQNSLYGGIDGYKKAMEAYREVMFTQPEQDAQNAIAAQRKLNTQWSTIYEATGRELPKTIAEFNTLRSTIDPNSPLFAALTLLGPTFAEVAEQAEAALADTQDLTVRLLNITGQEGLGGIYELRIKQEKELAEAVGDKSLLIQVQTLEMADAMKSAAGTISAATKKIIDTAKTALMDSLTIIQSILNTKKTLLTGPAAMLSPEAAYMQAKQQFENSNVNTVSANATAFIEASKNYSASVSAYQKDYQDVLAKLDSFTGVKGDLTDTEKQIELLDKIATAVNDGDTTMLKELKVKYDLIGIDASSAAGSLRSAIIAVKNAALGYNVDGTLILSEANIQLIQTTIADSYDAVKIALDAGFITTDATGKISGTSGALTGYAAIKSALDAGFTIDQATAKIGGTATTGYLGIKAALDAGIVVADAKNNIIGSVAGETGYAAVQYWINQGFSITDAKAKITGSEGFDGIKSALESGLNTGPNSISSLTTTFTDALTTAADNTKTGLTNFINALAIVSDYTQQRTEAQTSIEGLKAQYQTGTLSATEYTTQATTALEPLNTTITAGKDYGLTSLTAPSTALTSSDDDARMKNTAGGYGTLTKDINGNQSHSGATGIVGTLLDAMDVMGGYWRAGVFHKTNIFDARGNYAKYDLDQDTNISASDIRKWSQIGTGATKYSSYGLPAFATGGDHLGGFRIVGENGPELESTGASRIFNADQTRNIFANGQADNRDMVEAIARLEKRVEELLAEQHAANVAIAKNTGDSAKQLRRWDGEGTPPVREAA